MVRQLRALEPEDFLKHFLFEEPLFKLPLHQPIEQAIETKDGDFVLKQLDKEQETDYDDSLNKKWTTKYILQQKDEQDEGYILEVDLKIPEDESV